MEFIVFMLAAPWLAVVAATAAAWVGDDLVGRRPPQGADFTHRLGGGFDLLMRIATILMQAAIASLFVTVPAVWLEWCGCVLPRWTHHVDAFLTAGGIITYSCVSGMVVIVAGVSGLQAVDEWRRRHRHVVPAGSGDNNVSEDRDESNPFVAPRCK